MFSPWSLSSAPAASSLLSNSTSACVLPILVKVAIFNTLPQEKRQKHARVRKNPGKFAWTACCRAERRDSSFNFSFPERGHQAFGATSTGTIQQTTTGHSGARDYLPDGWKTFAMMSTVIGYTKLETVTRRMRPSVPGGNGRGGFSLGGWCSPPPPSLKVMLCLLEYCSKENSIRSHTLKVMLEPKP